MTTISVKQFVEATSAWAAQRDAQLKYYWPVNGGWEVWIQVDETAYLLSLDSTLEVLREQHVYTNSRKRCDMLLNTSQRTKNQVVIEIKAQSIGNTPTFIRDVKEDLDKLDELTDAYQEATYLVMVVVFDPATLDKVTTIERDAHRIFGVTYTGNEVAICFAHWSANGGWTKAQSITATSADATTWSPEASPASHAATHPMFAAPGAHPA